MTSNIHLQFLQQKITDLRSALFFSECNDLLRLPVSIINTQRVDEEGQIWFYINRPQQCMDAFKKEFAARLDFFRKGKNYSLKINGKAFIMEDEQANASAKEQHLLMVKVKMMTAEYLEREPQKASHSWRSFWTRFYNWLFTDSSYSLYAFNEEDIAVA